MARALNIDPRHNSRLSFDIADPNSCTSEILHHP
jgi:hypothetical protein